MDKLKTQNLNLKILVCAILFGVFASGCAGVKEAGRGFLGVSTKVLENNREGSLKKKFNFDYNSCSEKVIKSLKSGGTYIYNQDAKKGMIAVYISTEDTTPVGIFLTKIDANNTEVEVASPSSYGKKTIAKMIFDDLSGVVKIKKDKEKGLLDAAKAN